jgi:hypothetical protein
LDDHSNEASHDIPLAAASDHTTDPDHEHHDEHFEGLVEDHDLSISHAVNSFGEHSNQNTSEQVHQTYSDTCAIKSQQLILHDFGIHLTENQLRDEAIHKGWYVPSSFNHSGGTYPQDIGKLLEAHGIHVHQTYGGNVFSLVNELAQGHEVIVDVDANSLWHPSIFEKIKDVTTGDTPNHALIVAGINASDPQHIKVILKDPGTGDVGKEYSLNHFMDAWRDSNYLMVSTTQPVPNLKNFDYAKGHIDHIGHHSFEEFQAAHAHDISWHGASTDLAASDNDHDHYGPSSFVHKIVDFFDSHINPHHTDHTEVNNNDFDHDHDDDHDQNSDHDGHDH